uniref:Uncharacterized protein n=1 Tax=Aegilops tauschii subsp. strangulata TaxID=200361 RepID=A0A453S3S6_AEGTS
SIRYVDGNHALAAIADPFAAAEVLEEPPPPSLRTSRSPSGHRGRGSPRPPSSSERGMTPGRSSSGLPPRRRRRLPKVRSQDLSPPLFAALCSVARLTVAGGSMNREERYGAVDPSCLWIHWMRLGGVSAREIRSGCSVFQGGFVVSRLGRIDRCWIC